MTTYKMKPVLFALCLCLIASVSANAQTQPWDADIENISGAGYKYGVESGITPQTETEAFDCAVAWDVWHTAYAGKFMPVTIEDALPYPLKDITTASTRSAWQAVVARNNGTSPMLALIAIIEKNPKRVKAQNQLMAGLKGDKTALFRTAMMLGNCANPPIR
jgi:hypothetical protein